jgi:hypothetical protein
MKTTRFLKDMKCKFLVSILAVVLPVVAVAQTSAFYVNDSFVNCPPQIPPQVDATNFVNNNFFSINFTNLFSAQPYRMASVLNYTNNAYMYGNYGFQFDTGPSGAGTRRMANSFRNAGNISVGSIGNTNTFFNFFFNGFLVQSTLPKLMISATNISLRSSTNVVGINGLMTLTGKNLDLNRANITMEGFNDSGVIASSSNLLFFGNSGIFDGYWGIGTNIFTPSLSLATGVPTTPTHLVTAPGTQFFRSLSLPAGVAYVNETIIGTNRNVQVVILSDTNAAINENVYFPSTGSAVVGWQYPHTNVVTGGLETNYVYLIDDFGSFFTNALTFRSGLSAITTYVPLNYSFIRGGPYSFGTPFTPTSLAGVFDLNNVTNQYAAYRAVFAPTTQLPGNSPVIVISNLPGRIEVIADHVLDLTRAKINGLNYVRVQATNHFASSQLAQISSPYMDISLTSTNGALAITNLVRATLPRFQGNVDLWSGRWTNNGVVFANTYSVLVVDSHLSPTSPSVIQDLVLRSTNNVGGPNQITVSDVLNVSRQFVMNTERLTVTTNVVGAPTASGEINIQSSAITWSSAMPRLQYLTNDGVITSLNSVFFGGARTTPHYTSNYNEAYESFVNRGQIKNEGTLIWSKYFENTGAFNTGIGFGSISLQSTDARLTNGSFLALQGDVTITSGSLVSTNHSIQAGRELILNITNVLSDTGASNANTWVVGKGFSLPIKPAQGNLIGTVISETAGASENLHLWAAEDRGGTNSAGFQTNSAVGKVILNGTSPDSLFTFTGASSNNAIYIDYLDLRNFATNIDNSGNLTAVNVDPNMVVYYAQAVAGNISVAERLNHANGDRLRWVATHAGIYSSTNLVYPDGSTNSFNAALVQSENLDSDNDGLVNAADPTPLVANLALAVSITSQPALGANVSWRTVPYSANTVYYKSSPTATTWQELTNFNLGPISQERVSIFDPMSNNGSRVYRVKMTPPQP